VAENSPDPESKSAERLAFEIYLRTGRRLAAEILERKFNPYHDPRNGQFTFAPGGPRSIADPAFSDRHGLWKPKAKRINKSTSRKLTGTPKDMSAENSSVRQRALFSVSKTFTQRWAGNSVEEPPTDDLRIHLPTAARADGPLVRISATDDGTEHANCPEGSNNCRATVPVKPKDSNDVEIALNEYRRTLSENDWKDNDFDNLVDTRQALYTLRQREAIASGISDWDPTGLLPTEWLAENAIALDYDDPDSLNRRVAYYVTLGVDGPGPRPAVLTLENAMDPAGAARAQAAWLKKELLHQSYQALVGSDPIFASTAPVDISGARPKERGYSYEAEVRVQYGGDRLLRPPRFRTQWDGKEITGQADHVMIMNGELTAVDAKFTDNWMASLRNPLSNMGEEPWSANAQREMIAQAAKYMSAYRGGVIYHTNSVEFARFYSKVFRESGLTNYKFIITPSRKAI
jgi:hypothetical protein